MKFYGRRMVAKTECVELSDSIDAIIYNEKCPRYKVMDQLLTYAHYTDVEAQREELHSEDFGRIELAVERLTKAYETTCAIMLIRGE
jgi:hypothetical protein